MTKLKKLIYGTVLIGALYFGYQKVENFINDVNEYNNRVQYNEWQRYQRRSRANTGKPTHISEYKMDSMGELEKIIVKKVK